MVFSLSHAVAIITAQGQYTWKLVEIQKEKWEEFLREQKKIFKGLAQKWPIIVIFHGNDQNSKYMIKKYILKLIMIILRIKFPSKKLSLIVNFLLVQKIHIILIMQKDKISFIIFMTY